MVDFTVSTMRVLIKITCYVISFMQWEIVTFCILFGMNLSTAIQRERKALEIGTYDCATLEGQLSVLLQFISRLVF
jgi:hypothetical protein